jgi:hypothetical protein
LPHLEVSVSVLFNALLSLVNSSSLTCAPEGSKRVFFVQHLSGNSPETTVGSRILHCVQGRLG